MLTCKEHVALSSDFIDGQLAWTQRLRMRHHLLFCPDCRRFIGQLRLVCRTIQALPEVPSDDVNDIAERLARERLNANAGDR
ncbi:zf-HC2 domain-containing protein [Pseudomonas sp. DWP3-1-2]|uniref:zf-HC2 domain-containing protein n=1 Tax=Pseudomonas sp. DWP3-1-2 TaxID=2804645 RepID=UPI003CEFB4C8